MSESKKDNTRRLAKNTMFLYFRSIFCLIVSLYSSRLFLAALGVDDYGINNAVGGFAGMFALVTGSLSSAISRFLTFEQGTGNFKRQKEVFAMSLNLMIGFSLIILILALTFGDWFVSNKMTIPDGRETAALWAFFCSIVMVMGSLVSSSFNSAIIAHERMGIYAFISVAEAILRLALALFLTFGSYTLDRLILYTIVWTLISLLLNAFTIIYAAVNFPECRFKLFFDPPLFKEMFGYAGWNFVSSISNTLSGQGVNVLMNIFFGPAVNAARGLSNTVQRSVAMFVNNFTIALTPQITKAYANKDMDYVKYLTYRGSRFAFYILFIISLPVILEADFVFNLWLKEVPKYTVDFNRLALISNLIGLFFTIFINVQHASGDVRNFKLAMSLVILLQFPVCWILLKMGCTPIIVYLVTIACQIVNIFVTHHFTMQKMTYSYRELIREIYFPEAKVIVCSTILPLLSVLFLPYGWWRFLLTGTLCVACTVPSVLYLGCSASERVYIYDAIGNFLRKKGLLKR